MDTCASAKVPMSFRHQIFSDPSGVAVNQNKYMGMIGSLLYLTASHPDIMFSTCLCARFQANSDSNYGGLQMDRKSNSGGCQFLGGKLVSWSSKKQNCITLSTAEAKYIAAASFTSQAHL
ncbi:uncharacterized mitochondrial protein AtMg00810-like [Lactuca sativa]|uniref:uncharacterized mitochondrial protein AtMg00810-like n=1 Tax=Lactuca sativa TaxID=4236 RepID=UPI000CD93249|nr:uncharacterized mitochondrial protein AtMg00810-like [Lactuca sativa]